MFTEIFREKYEATKQEREADMLLAVCSKLDVLLNEAMDLERRRVTALENIACALQASSIAKQVREGAAAPKHVVSPYTGRHLREDGTIQ